MTAALWVSIVVAVISTGGLIIVMVGNSRTTLERTNIENAKDISAQYKKLNDNLREEMDIKFKAMDKKIKEMQEAFSKREAFLEREIEIRDIRIGKLEALIILKDNVIANLKGGKKDE